MHEALVKGVMELFKAEAAPGEVFLDSGHVIVILVVGKAEKGDNCQAALSIRPERGKRKYREAFYGFGITSVRHPCKISLEVC